MENDFLKEAEVLDVEGAEVAGVLALVNFTLGPLKVSTSCCPDLAAEEEPEEAWCCCKAAAAADVLKP